MLKKCASSFRFVCLGLSALGLLALAGCGGGGNTNVVSVTVSPSSGTIIVSQSITLTAIVSGSTNTDISGWTCQYFTTTVDSSGSPKQGSNQTCTADTGTIPANTTDTTVTYTAPNKVPDPTKLTGSNCAASTSTSQQVCLLSILITATAAADTKKTGSSTLTLDSGIAVALSPTTATVPTKEQEQFNASLSNDLDPTNQGVNWLITQTTPTGSQTFPSLPTCSPGCGKFVSTTANTMVYQAPDTLPTTATVTLVASSKADPTRLALGTITIIQGGPIQFNTISPTIAPQGAAFYNIYLDAPNISSASTITLKRQSDNTTIPINSTSNQIKVVFPVPSSSTATPSSTGARLTLNAANLQVDGVYTVSVSDPGQPVTTCTGTPLPSGCAGQGNFSFEVKPVRPTSVASIPDSFQQGSSNESNLTVDGGYFGQNGTIANVFFGNQLPKNQDSSSNARQMNVSFDANFVNAQLPGLYPLSVSRTTPPLPTPDNPSVTDIAIFPDYSGTSHAPNLAKVIATQPTGQKPSAVDIDYKLGVLAVAEAGASNQVEFFQIAQNSLTPIPCPVTTGSKCTVNAPTGLSINQSNHTVAVVSPQDNEVVVLPLPCPSGVVCTTTPQNNSVVIGAQNVTYPKHISLAGLLPDAVSPAPLPYSIGVDSDTNMGVVAYSSSAIPTLAKVGFLIDLNADQQTCLLSSATPPCVFAQVTLNAGTYPQIAMVPHSHTALVTPGGAGVVSGIDVTKPSSQLEISNISLISGVVTVTVHLDTNQTMGINPGNPGTVLIQNVPNGSTNGVVFNGVFTVQSVINSNSFTYLLNSASNDAVDPTKCDPTCGTVSFSAPNVIVGISQTSQGIAINSVTRTAAISDANATGSNGPQINLLNSLDQNIGSILFHAGCTANNTSASNPCSNAPELLGTTSVAFQPYTNSLVSYNSNPALNALAKDQVSISNPVSLQRQTFVLDSSDSSAGDPNGNYFLSGTGSSTICIPNATPCAGTTLNLFGGLAVDPATNQAFVVQSGSNQIRIVNLQVDPTNSAKTLMKPAQITELQVPTVAGALIGGIKGAVMSQGTLSSNSDLAGVLISGSGFDSNTQVRLDGVAIPSGNVHFVTSRLLNVTIPASFLFVSSGPTAPSPLSHRYAVDVINSSGVRSNSTDFYVITAVDLSKTAPNPICKDSSGNGLDAQPSSVAIADQLPGKSFTPIAVVTNSGCGSVSIINIDPNNNGFGTLTAAKTIPTGTGPMGVAISQRYGLAVVSNNSDGTASVLDLVAGTQKVPAVTVGSEPMGVAISDDTGIALVANSGNATVSRIDFSVLFPQPGSTTTVPTSLTASTIGVDRSPIAVAIDPDRGTNNRGLAVVTALQLVSGGTAIGALDAVDIGSVTPAKATTGAIGGSVTATPTGIVFDPSVSPKLFYATSSGGNVVTAFNPDTGGTSSVRVGINPTSLAINPQTGGIMTINFTGQTVSIIDTVSNPFTTRRTYGLGGSAQFGVAIDQFTNLAVLADQANNRVLIFPMPN